MNTGRVGAAAAGGAGATAGVSLAAGAALSASVVDELGALLVIVEFVLLVLALVVVLVVSEPASTGSPLSDPQPETPSVITAAAAVAMTSLICGPSRQDEGKFTLCAQFRAPLMHFDKFATAVTAGAWRNLVVVVVTYTARRSAPR
ncbi:UNVERIFIED_ORG: hypothetical protein EDC92_11425 [Dietzia maris]|uniref:hypothetical protein n=1 Tax=Dietzia maris TaxID=37915 RepID=UPI001046EA97